jgi:hypothetical protein
VNDANVATLSLNLETKEVTVSPNPFFSYLHVPGDPIFVVKNAGFVNILFEIVRDGSQLDVKHLSFAVWDDYRSTGSWIVLTPTGDGTNEHGLSWAVEGNNLRLTSLTSSEQWVEHCRFAATVATATSDDKTCIFILDPKIYNDGSPPG